MGRRANPPTQHGCRRPPTNADCCVVRARGLARLRSDRRKVRSTASKLLEIVAPGGDESSNYARASVLVYQQELPIHVRDRRQKRRTVPGYRQGFVPIPRIGASEALQRSAGPNED